MSEKAIIESVLQPSNSKPSPILLNFQNGNLTTVEKETTKFFSTRDEKTKKDGAVVLAGGNIYHGTVGEGYPTDLMDTYIAVRNKITNKVRFIPTNQVSLSNYIYQQKDNQIDCKLNSASSLDIMMRNFGGRKAKIYMERDQRMKINVNTIKDQLEETVNGFDFSQSMDTVTADNNINSIRPVFDVAAKKLDDVYNIYDVVSKDLLDRLSEEANAIFTTDISNIPISSEYLLNQIAAVQKSLLRDSPQNLTRIKIFIYMDGLIALIKTRVKNLSRAELSKISEKVENDIRVNFSAPDLTNRIRTSFSCEKGMCYFIVLALLTSDNFEIDVNILVQQLSMPRPKILKYAHYVNAKLKPRSDILALQLPGRIKPLKMALGKRKK